jgi:CRISPR-associated protein Cst2
MSEKKSISSISICGQLKMDMHSLNNEGSEGNQLLTRQVTILDEKDNLVNVNAVSGDMLKHIQSEYLWKIANEENITLCDMCKKFNPNRISGDKEFEKEIKEKSNSDSFDALLEKCIIDDLSGVMITADKKNVGRKSISEYGWLIGIPENIKTESYFHVKLTPSEGKGKEVEGSNTGQNIFHRTASSGIYALVSNFEVFRIGYNDINKTYKITDEERLKRYKALLKSVLYTFIEPKGAMRNTQNPHILGFSGVVTISTKLVPAPTVSPLKNSYKEEIKSIVRNVNKIENDSVESFDFESFEDFTNIISELLGYSIYKMK